MHEVLVTKTFAMQLKKLEQGERERIKKKLLVSAKNPWLFFARLKGSKFFRLRVGKYRVLATILSVDKKIIVLSVEHRKKAYRKL